MTDSDEASGLDLDAQREFYDPHPGFAGAAIPIPSAMKTAAEVLDGQQMSLRTAVAALRFLAVGRIEIVAKHSYILLRLGGNGRPEHVFRVIRFR